MLRSYFNLLVSVRRVTQKSTGRKTAGVDGETVLTSEHRMELVRSMGDYTLWKAKPTRRIYIPKPGKPGQRRPLGIPTIRNRIAQTIVKNALEPCWEATFEPNSYGFRPGRSIHDAIEHCHLFFRKGSKRPWVLDADIRGAFDNVSHDYILFMVDRLPGRELIRQWLKAGYMEAEMFHETPHGTPQGGVISPAMLNVALNGLQAMLGGAYGYVRYADDLIVCAKSREDIEAARLFIEAWLKIRGLELHPEKTRITEISSGINFLGFHIRTYKGKCLIKPQKEKVLSFLAGLQKWLNRHRATAPEHVIRYLNPKLQGWANNYKRVASTRTFSYVSFRLWQMLWRWCLRRHPNKGKAWVKERYFPRDERRQWQFQAQAGDDKLRLFDISSVKIERHVKVRSDSYPDDPSMRDYWQDRAQQRLRRSKVTKARRTAGSEARAV